MGHIAQKQNIRAPLLPFLCCLLCIATAVIATPFPQTAVINLARHTSRRANVTQELSSHNISFSFIDAVDGTNLTNSELSRNATALARWFMTPGMIGCFLSHRRCWEKCVRSGKPLLVFEDDVVLDEKFGDVAKAAMERLEDCDCDYDACGGDGIDLDDRLMWDVLLLGAIGCVHPEKKYGFNWIPSLVGGHWRTTRQVGAKLLLPASKGGDAGGFPPQYASIHVPMCPYGMHAYVLSPRGAAKLLALCPRASFHVDAVAWGRRELTILAVHPLVARQTNLDTTIGTTAVYAKDRILPRFVADTYTGFELVWALSAPLLRLGGPMLGGRLMLTTGRSLAIMGIGLVISGILRSKLIFSATLLYVAVITAMVRLLASKWNY